MTDTIKDEKTAQDKPQPYTTVELRFPGRNTLSELAEVLNPDLQDCVARLNVVDPNEFPF